MRKERMNCKVLLAASFLQSIVSFPHLIVSSLYSIVSFPHLIVSSPRRRGSRRQWKQSNSSRIFQGFVLVTFLLFTNISQLNASLDPRLRGDDNSGDLVNLLEEPQGFMIPLEAKEESISAIDRKLKGDWGFTNESTGDTIGGCSSCGG